MRHLDFWYEFASTYSYLAVLRIEALAREAGVALRWRPFLLGPIFSAQGWLNSPFNLYPAKGRYMWRDLERICAARGQPFTRPPGFPQNSLHAARLALAVPEARRPDFSRAVFVAQFGFGKVISDETLLAGVLAELDLPADLLEKSKSDPIRALLREETETAKKIGLFGAPSFVAADGEIFWGDDRLEQALDWRGRA
ncbi:2-hydroxychromene-2-carboxylate isomerase [Rhodoblastus acidophilus]|uniref:2-hydroxychromene-2-carboxylate isomerase n=1 Tax=Rhodoblastus acidophilus TaxID=1074 RepID=UPI0029CAC179|nr:2-hydroxychromene-2-carboxylate isomerase [Rhodoblastus acidophilus]MCW2284667.1 2-hydroxychromene-2-carboxylate isomerase [Rhodoblastus acidophilus]MCW2333620.1 2-hydroxychromene-2-carboxylate isomerase [Rhodoblastus acidophilus]